MYWSEIGLIQGQRRIFLREIIDHWQLFLGQYHFSYNCFRTVLFVQLFFVRTFCTSTFRTVLFVQIQGGGGKSPRVRAGISSHKLLLRRGLFAPLASNFAPPLLYLYEKYLYEKYLYEKSVRKLIVRKVPYENNCTKSDTAEKSWSRCQNMNQVMNFVFWFLPQRVFPERK